MSEKPMKLVHVTRLDSFPAFRANYTEEGYLKDKPILTSTGIFEYKNSDGTTRRELRLPEDVFDPESLASYKGKPIVITHDAGLINTDNVHDNQIGTILTVGEKDGDDVRAEIVIHDTDALKQCRYKELSLGYNLDLEETPGVWNGQKYDAIQRNISVNHLAVVREARAGDQARLNIDSRADKTIMTGGHKTMAKKKAAKKSVIRNDGILSPEELQKAIADYKARRAAAKTDEDDSEAKAAKLADQEVIKPQEEVPPQEPAVENPKAVPVKKDSLPKPAQEATVLPDQSKPVDEKLQAVKNRRDLRDEKGDPEDMNGAMEQIAEQDEEIDFLCNIIDTLLAEKDFGGNGGAGNTDADTDPIPANNKAEAAAKPNLTDEDRAEAQADSDEEDDPEETNEDGADCEDKTNCDSDDEEEEDLVEDEGDEDDEDDEEFEEDEDEDTDAPAPFPPKDENEEDLSEDEDDEEEEEFEEDGDDDCIPSRMNQDSIDAIFQKQLRKRMEIAKIGSRLNLDGLEYQPIPTAKKKIIKKVRPGIRLDGKSEAYIDALYRLCVDDVKKSTKKDTAYQRRQMFQKVYNADSRTERDSAEAHRDGMIKKENSRRNNGKKN